MATLEKVDIRLLRHFAQEFQVLQLISRKLHKQDENACNYGLSKRQEIIVKHLLEEAEKRANYIGLHAYHQGDPRGCSLYLVDDEVMERGINAYYTDGIAVY